MDRAVTETETRTSPRPSFLAYHAKAYEARKAQLERQAACETTPERKDEITTRMRRLGYAR